ncbi:glycosyltransferase family 39 protein [Streptomyces sp. NRRL F-5123]|uniref:glycosyltransferase family 39 protein n=1 Tax=Streptomyces sp. NRRL F-5123 TaxID=1463856 RepID=UPI0004E272BD|nr:glycosyltransferase family 39 protein [Streptomyces sp. NRRL F-5123]
MPPSRSTVPRPPVWLVPVLWTSALGLWGLSRQHSMWRDEAATWQAAQRSPEELCGMLRSVDVVHGLYYLLMHELFACFGASTTTLRLPSVLAMAVAAGCVALLGQRLASARAGLAAGTVFGLLPAVQFYLQEGRPYAMVTAGAALATLLLVTLLQGRGGAARWAAYGGTVALCGLLNWLSLLMLPAHAATLLWTRAGRGSATPWAAASAAATAAVLPLILYSRTQQHQVAWIAPLTWSKLISPAVLLAIGALAAAVVRPSAGRLSATTAGLPLLAAPQLALLAISLSHPLHLDRYVVFSLSGLALLIGAALDAAARATAHRWPVPVAVTALTLALLPQCLAERSPSSRVDDVLAVAAHVQRLKSPDAAVLFIPSWRRDTAYGSPDAFAGLHDIALSEGPLESATLEGVEAPPARIRTAMLAQHRILLVTDAEFTAEANATARDRTKMSVLHSHFTKVADIRTRGRPSWSSSAM